MNEVGVGDITCGPLGWLGGCLCYRELGVASVIESWGALSRFGTPVAGTRLMVADGPSGSSSSLKEKNSQLTHSRKKC